MSPHLSGWAAEDLCAAVLKDLGASHVEKASPRRTRHHRNGTTQARPAFDFWGVFDILALTDEALVAVQVTRNTSLVSEKMVGIVDAGPWPEYMTVQLWEWSQEFPDVGEPGFHIHELHYDYDGMPGWSQVRDHAVPDPKAVLHRADESLDEVVQ